MKVLAVIKSGFKIKFNSALRLGSGQMAGQGASGRAQPGRSWLEWELGMLLRRYVHPEMVHFTPFSGPAYSPAKVKTTNEPIEFNSRWPHEANNLVQACLYSLRPTTVTTAGSCMISISSIFTRLGA